MLIMRIKKNSEKFSTCDICFSDLAAAGATVPALAASKDMCMAGVSLLLYNKYKDALRRNTMREERKRKERFRTDSEQLFLFK